MELSSYEQLRNRFLDVAEKTGGKCFLCPQKLRLETKRYETPRGFLEQHPTSFVPYCGDCYQFVVDARHCHCLESKYEGISVFQDHQIGLDNYALLDKRPGLYRQTKDGGFDRAGLKTDWKALEEDEREAFRMQARLLKASAADRRCFIDNCPNEAPLFSLYKQPPLLYGARVCESHYSRSEYTANVVVPRIKAGGRAEVERAPADARCWNYRPNVDDWAIDHCLSVNGRGKHWEAFPLQLDGRPEEKIWLCPPCKNRDASARRRGRWTHGSPAPVIQVKKWQHILLTRHNRKLVCSLYSSDRRRCKCLTEVVEGGSVTAKFVIFRPSYDAYVPENGVYDMSKLIFLCHSCHVRDRDARRAKGYVGDDPKPAERSQVLRRYPEKNPKRKR